MLVINENGWNELRLANCSERIGCLNNIYDNCLDAFIRALQNNIPATVYFDAEGYDFHLISSYYKSYVIVDADTVIVYEDKKNIVELAKELYSDIKNNFSYWTSWDLDGDETNEELLSNIEKLTLKLDALNAEILLRENKI